MQLINLFTLKFNRRFLMSLYMSHKRRIFPLPVAELAFILVWANTNRFRPFRFWANSNMKLQLKKNVLKSDTFQLRNLDKLVD